MSDSEFCPGRPVGRPEDNEAARRALGLLREKLEEAKNREGVEAARKEREAVVAWLMERAKDGVA